MYYLLIIQGRLSRSCRERAIYSLHSAAQWVVPYGRDGTHSFYCDESGAELLQKALDMITATKGPNIILRIPINESLFEDAIEQAPDIFCTVRSLPISIYGTETIATVKPPNIRLASCFHGYERPSIRQ